MLADQSPLIVALTADAFTSDGEACIQAGMEDYLSKPLKKDELNKILIQYSQQIENKKWA